MLDSGQEIQYHSGVVVRDAMAIFVSGMDLISAKTSGMSLYNPISSSS